MDALNIDLLLKLLVAHFLSDFILQPTKLAKKKDEHGVKSWHLYLHIIITAASLCVVLWDIALWPVILIITLTHFIIDAAKSQFKQPNIWVFIIDQILHILVIIGVWLTYTKQWRECIDLWHIIANNTNFWWLLLSYIVLTIPTSVLIGKMTNKWSNELNDSPQDNGLKSAGKWIGIIERILIFTFIIINKLSVIGLLLTAKSVFRFGDLKDSAEQKKTEYIILGTFISFLLAILLGIGVKFIIA